ncbi:IS66-like element accessory protein TnpA [Lichenibacterium dinghuense]|uniref:IS66-like element accessory protein TnpA n=1 Tax=Lichenibacterium dinghuense TaxID=2895977 RepID=UPI001F29A7C7|nr:transposase [Lichenibacterium sp. 6Y81]
MAQQLNVVELGRRRRWSEDEKLRIVMESLEAPRLVSPTARRYGISRSLLMAWRRALKVERAAPDPAPAFVPAVVVPETLSEAKPMARRARRQAAQGRMVIEVGRGRRVVVDGAVDAEALARVLDVLDRR